MQAATATTTAVTRRVWAHIDLGALRHNYRRVSELAAGARIMPALKANAYGHGAVDCARALETADAFGVATLAEACELREAGIRVPIVLMSGFSEAAELPLIQQLELVPVLHADWQLDAARAFSGALRVWIKLDTGMGRLGFAPGQAREIAGALQHCPHIELVGWMTHFACADEPGNAHTAAQIATFDQAVAGLPGARSLANSAGILAWPQAHRDWVRPGIMLYGATPLPGTPAVDLGLRPVMSLHARLLAVKALQAGETVGYGATWQCGEPTRVGIVAAGYADGLPRALRQGCPVRVGGAPAALIGRVSMDLITVDLRQAPQACPGDTVTFWGAELSVDEVAEQAGTIGYELLVALGGRVERIHTTDAPGA